MVIINNEEFNRKLLDGENPFPYPEPPLRPSFIIGGEPYLRWFENEYKNRTRQEGTSGVFIVGMPGAGKTHFLRHHDYLFYQKGKFKGLYAIITLSDQEIDEKEIWKELFLRPDSAERLTSLLPKEEIMAAQIRPDIKTNILKLVNQTLDLNSLSVEAIRKIAEHVSNLLPNESIICFAFDNIEEYLSARENEYLIRAKTIPSEALTKQRATAEAVELLVEKIRNMTSNIRRAIVLLSLTTPAWVEVRKTAPARTKARRFRFAEKEQVLSELTLPQCFQLVHKYMEQWCIKNGLSLPKDYEDCMCTVGSKTVSLYPFTSLSVELARRITDQLAGDIVCFCSECINQMRNKGYVEIVRDQFAIECLLAISTEYPWLGWASRARTILEEMGPVILKKHLTEKLKDLEKLTRKKYELGIDPETIANSINRFADVLGVMISLAPAVEDSYSPNGKPIQASKLLNIWSFGETKIAVKYVIGKEREHIPKAKLYGGRVTFRDYADVISLIDAEKATHGLLIYAWAVEDYRFGSGLHQRLNELGKTFKTINISDDVYKIVAVAEASEEQKVLAEFVDRIFVNLRERLTVLVHQKRPEIKPLEKYKTEKYARFY